MRGTAAEGNCATKTGTLDGVSALSGYCNAHGHTIAFSVLNNSVYDRRRALGPGPNRRRDRSIPAVISP